MENTFGAKVIVNYGCHEVVGIAFGYDSSNLEMTEDVIIDEEPDERFENGYKRCVVSNLVVKSMPFIKYELSDLIMKKGNTIKTYGFRWMENLCIQGVTVHCSFFSNIFEEYEEIKLYPLENFQIIYTDETITFVLIEIEDRYINGIKCYVKNQLYKNYYINPEIFFKKSRHFFADKLSGKMRGILKEQDVWYEFGNINMLD